jgi:hypothetical protein
MRRRLLILGALGLALARTGFSRAGEIVPFDRAAFAAAQQAGQPIVVFVHAPW